MIGRELSAVERWYWICDGFSPLNVVSRARVRGPLGEPELRRGLDAVQARHPLLSVAVAAEPDGTRPRWVPSEAPIPLRVVDGDERTWESEVDTTELGTAVDSARGPMCRAVAVRAGDDAWDLVLTVPHQVADGTTVLSLLSEWIRASAGEPLGEPARELPPTDDMVPAADPAPSEDPAPDGAERPGRVEPRVALPLERRRSRLLHHSIDGRDLDELVAACRREETTVNAALCAALATAAAADHGREHGETPDRFGIGSPIDFRSELQPPVRPDEVGTFVATVPTVVDVALPFWDRARAAGADLAGRRRRREHFDLVRMVVGACPASTEEARPFMEFMEAQGPINLVLTNVGRAGFVPESAGALTVSQAQFLTGISVNGYVVAAVTTTGSSLAWNLTYIDEAVPAERARRVADDALAELRAAVGTPDPAWTGETR